MIFSRTTFRIFRIVACVFLSSFIAAAFATEGGNGVRGGGSFAYLNGKAQLKELFKPTDPAGSAYRLSENTLSTIRDLRELADRYDGTASSPYWDAVLGPEASYRIIDGKPPCVSTEADLEEKIGNTDFYVYGCTEFGITYFEKARISEMSGATLVLAILHQRGHAFDQSARAHDWIEPWIRGLSTLLELKIAEEAGGRPRLTPIQMENLHGLLPAGEVAAKLLGQTPALSALRGANYEIHPWGGGLLVYDFVEFPDPAQKLDSTNYVGVGSRLSWRIEICGNRGWRKSETPEIPFQYNEILNSIIECGSLVRSKITDSSVRFRGQGVNGKDQNPRSFEFLPRIEDVEIRSSRVEMRGTVNLLKDRFINAFVVRDRDAVNQTLRDSDIIDSSLYMDHALGMPINRQGETGGLTLRIHIDHDRQKCPSIFDYWLWGSRKDHLCSGPQVTPERRAQSIDQIHPY